MFQCSNNILFTELGSLDAESLTMVLLGMPAPWDEVPDEQNSLHRTFTHTVINHELRHFRDIIGTEAGFALFMNTLDIVGGFTASFPELRTLDPLKVPLVKFAQESTVPECVRKIVDIYKAKDLMIKVANGDIGLEQIPGRQELSVVWRPAEFVANNIRVSITLPFLYNPLVDITSGDDYTAKWPIGFRTLIEGNAFALQSFMTAVKIVGEVSSKEDDYLDKLSAELRRCEALYRTSPYPYLVTRKTCSVAFRQLLKTKDGKARIYNGHLEMGLSDLALMLTTPRASTLDLFAEMLPGRHPGVCFLQAVTKAQEILGQDREREFECVELLDLICDQLKWERYSMLPTILLEKWQKEEQWLESKLGSQPALADEVIRRALRWHIEMLEERERNLSVMANPKSYLDALTGKRLPVVPQRIWGAAGDGVVEEELWFHWLVFLHAMYALLTGRSKTCIKYDRGLGGVATVDDKLLPCAETEGHCAFFETGLRSGTPCYLGGLLALWGLADTKFEWID